MIELALLAAGLLGLVAVLTVLGIATWVAHKTTLVRRIPVQGHPSQHGLAYEDVTFPSRHDRVPIRGWYLPGQGDGPCILLIQGQDHHRNSPGIKALWLAKHLVDAGFRVLLFDFRGRGESGGRRGSSGDREQWDVLGALDYLAARGSPPERVGLVGFSLGAGVALLVAASEPRIPAVVCDSGFLDILPDMERVPFAFFVLPAWFASPIMWVARLMFGADLRRVRPIQALAHVAPRPILFIHGESDHVIAHEETEALYAASQSADNELWIVPGAGHVRSFATRPEEYTARVTAFFHRHIGPG